MSEPLTTKSAIRTLMKSRLASAGAAEVEPWSVSICQHLAAWGPFTKAAKVLGYAPHGVEPDIRPLLEQILRRGSTLCLPRVGWDAGTMEAVAVTDLDRSLTATRHGILQPLPSAPALALKELDFVLVPGLAFDRSGNRLGRGAGFYDRFLADQSLAAVTCGVGFELQLLDKLPTDRWDIPLHALVTESTLREFR